MSNDSVETGMGIIDVTKLSLRELGRVDASEREPAIRSAYEQTIRGGISSSSQSNQPEFSDLSLRHDDK